MSKAPGLQSRGFHFVQGATLPSLPLTQFQIKDGRRRLNRQIVYSRNLIGFQSERYMIDGVVAANAVWEWSLVSDLGA